MSRERGRDANLWENPCPVCSYNQLEGDFPNLQAYNDYLEEVETIGQPLFLEPLISWPVVAPLSVQLVQWSGGGGHEREGGAVPKRAPDTDHEEQGEEGEGWTSPAPSQPASPLQRQLERQVQVEVREEQQLQELRNRQALASAKGEAREKERDMQSIIHELVRPLLLCEVQHCLLSDGVRETSARGGGQPHPSARGSTHLCHQQRHHPANLPKQHGWCLCVCD